MCVHVQVGTGAKATEDLVKEILDEGLRRFPTYDKLWLMLGQYQEDHDDFLGAKARYVSGIKASPECVPLWLSLVRLELSGKVPGGGKLFGLF